MFVGAHNMADEPRGQTDVDDKAAAPAAAASAAAEDELPECCRTGFLTKGTAKGSEIKVGDIATYVARPAAPSKFAMVLLTDVFGHVLPNVRVLADAMAGRSGYNVYVPDIMNGDPMPYETMMRVMGTSKSFFDSLAKPFLIVGALPGMIMWMNRHGPQVTTPIVERFLKALREGDEAQQKVVTIGYCFGGKYSIDMAATDLIDAYAVAHPSRVAVPADIEKINNKPGLYLCAGSDFMFSDSMIKTTKEVLARKNLRAEFRHYPGTSHGFAVRGDESDPVVAKASEDAMNEFVAFCKSVFEPTQ